MKELVILSGKGGTGKTSLTASFARLAERPVIADCDVDAANLHLVLAPTLRERREFFSGHQAVIMEEVCCNCGVCLPECRFGAILPPSPESGHETYWIDPTACEGCGVCEAVCPVNAVSMRPAVAGEQMLYRTAHSVFSTAQLKMGSGTSGKLVTEVKKQMLSSALPQTEFAIIDGSPGIGCPVIASLSGVSMVLIVAEPSVSGISDMGRILHTAEIFHTPTCVCVNKADVNYELTKQIERFCEEKQIPFVGTIPYDPQAVTAINDGITIVEIDCPSGRAVRQIYAETLRLLQAGARGIKE